MRRSTCHPLHPIQIGPCRFQRRRRRRRRPPTSHHQSRSRIRQRNQSRNLRTRWRRGRESRLPATGRHASESATDAYRAVDTATRLKERLGGRLEFAGALAWGRSSRRLRQKAFASAYSPIAALSNAMSCCAANQYPCSSHVAIGDGPASRRCTRWHLHCLSRLGSGALRRSRLVFEVRTGLASRVNFFMNKFRKLGFIEYNGGLKVNHSLLTVILHD